MVGMAAAAGIASRPPALLAHGQGRLLRALWDEGSSMSADLEATPAPPADAESMHVYAHEFDPIGGWVCSECGTPTESEPCQEHQPAAYAAMT